MTNQEQKKQLLKEAFIKQAVGSGYTNEEILDIYNYHERSFPSLEQLIEKYRKQEKEWQEQNRI